MGKRRGAQRSSIKSTRTGKSAEEEETGESVLCSSSQGAGKETKILAMAEDVSAATSYTQVEGSSVGNNSHPPVSKSQLREQHKKEYQALKKKTTNMGKKMKEEAAALMKALKERHEMELAELTAVGGDGEGVEDEAHDATTVSDISLYGASMDSRESTKLMKAQKRRAHAAQKDAHREARIAKENAAIGESDRIQEERLLNEKLSHLGLKLFDIKADGHCLYSAVHHQLERMTNDYPSAQNLREKAAEYMRIKKEDFLPFFVDESAENIDDAFENHCWKVENTAEWGGEMELEALAQALDRSIIVHSVHLPETTLGQQKNTKEPIRVCFMKHAYGLGNHYNSVTEISSV